MDNNIDTRKQIQNSLDPLSAEVKVENQPVENLKVLWQDTTEKELVQEGIPDNSEENITGSPSLIEKLKDKKGIWGILGALLLLLFKFKFVAIFLFSKLKFLLVVFKIGKFGSTFLSMFIMIWSYALFYGWAFGVGFVLLIFIHEMGHYFMAKQLKLNVSAPLFIPFLGALVAMKEEPKDAVVEASMAMGGPLLGSFGAFLCFIAYYFNGQDFFLALAYTGFMLNLFNLIPMHPIDGGRIVSAISPKFWYIGIPIMTIAAIKFFNPILFLFIFLGVMQAYNNWKNPREDYYAVPHFTRITFAALYFSLIAALGSGMYYIHNLHQGGFKF